MISWCVYLSIKFRDQTNRVPDLILNLFPLLNHICVHELNFKGPCLPPYYYYQFPCNKISHIYMSSVYCWILSINLRKPSLGGDLKIISPICFVCHNNLITFLIFAFNQSVNQIVFEGDNT